MRNKRWIAIGFVLVLVQYLFLFLPLATNMICISDCNFDGAQSAIQMMGDYGTMLTRTDLWFTPEPLTMFLCGLALMVTIAFIVIALTNTVFAADRDESSEHRLALLRTASCFLAAIPLTNCGLVLLMGSWDWAPYPTLFGILMTALPLGFIPLFRRLSPDFPLSEPAPKATAAPDWQRFLSEDE